MASPSLAPLCCWSLAPRSRRRPKWRPPTGDRSAERSRSPRTVVAPPLPPAVTQAPPGSAPPTPPSREPPSTERPITSVVFVGVQRANFRQSPDVKARILAVLTKGTKLTVLEKRAQWYRVRLDDGKEGLGGRVGYFDEARLRQKDSPVVTGRWYPAVPSLKVSRNATRSSSSAGVSLSGRRMRTPSACRRSSSSSE